MANKVLVVDDEKLIVKGLKFSLEQDGMQVECAYDGEEALECARKNSYDMILLDIMLPKMDGMEVCQQIREFSDVPIIMLTAKGEDMDKILGLEYGADDYITKPYDVDEFVARVNAQLRLARMNRRDAEQAEALSRGPLSLDTVALRAFLDGKDMRLTAREFSVLLFLLRNEGRILSADEIYEGVWKQPMSGNAGALWKCMSRLKNKLAVSDEISLMSFRKEGYMLEVMEK